MLTIIFVTGKTRYTFDYTFIKSYDSYCSLVRSRQEGCLESDNLYARVDPRDFLCNYFI